MARIVRVWIGNDYVEFEFEDNSDWTEDELYEAVVEDVKSYLKFKGAGV